jgi:uncharacterized protein (DUF983 family)
MALKLTELDPHWYVLENGGPVVGISFECPHCRTQRLYGRLLTMTNARMEIAR